MRMRAIQRRRGLAAALLFFAAAIASVGNELGSIRTSFLSTGLPGFGEAAVGDHLQTSWWFWLVGHQLGQGSAPWIDPYSFQPILEPQVVFGGWAFGLAYWPLHVLFGPVLAWNLLLIGVTALAGAVTYAWLRTLDVPVAAALAGALVFELAPYRFAQSGAHLLGWVAIFLPVALLGIERSRIATTNRSQHAWGALAALATLSIPLSGQPHLALGTIPFVLAYAAVRFRRVPFAWALAGTVAAVGAGLLVNALVIRGSTESAGRALEEIESFQASWFDFVDRTRDGGLEDFVFMGWLVPFFALGGLVVLARRAPWVAGLLALSVAVPSLLALGTNTPVFEAVRDVFPPLRYPRVPGRLMPVADIAVAGLAAFGAAALLARSRTRARLAVGAAVVVLVATDLTVWPLRATAADPDNAAYEAVGPGRTLELPIAPGVFGSPYLLYTMQEPHERPGGYATVRPKPQQAFIERWRRLNCGEWRPGDNGELAALGVGWILLHRGLYRFLGDPAAAELAEAGLVASGWRPVRTDGRITLYSRTGEATGPGPDPGDCRL